MLPPSFRYISSHFLWFSSSPFNFFSFLNIFKWSDLIYSFKFEFFFKDNPFLGFFFLFPVTNHLLPWLFQPERLILYLILIPNLTSFVNQPLFGYFFFLSWWIWWGKTQDFEILTYQSISIYLNIYQTVYMYLQIVVWGWHILQLARVWEYSPKESLQRRKKNIYIYRSGSNGTIWTITSIPYVKSTLRFMMCTLHSCTFWQ